MSSENSIEDVKNKVEYKRWYKCGVELRGFNDDGLLEKIYMGSVLKDDEAMEYLMAVIHTESRWNISAVSHANAYGLTQMTSVAVKEAAKECNLPVLKNMKDLYGPKTSAKYSSCYLRKLLRDADNNWMEAITIYNGGYQQLTRLLNGNNMVHETANYVVKVLLAKNKCENIK